MLDTKPLLAGKGFPKLKRDSLEILQVNLGYKCNLSCTHCHVKRELTGDTSIDPAHLFVDCPLHPAG